jgi:glutathione-regulated potassium-efflux system ancillary protein KefC
MHGTGFLLPALVYLAAAVIVVPLFKRLGLGTVLGYLAAGVAIGPWGLKLVTDFAQVQQVSELGVVLLLFLVGLELNPRRLWALRHSIFGLGLLQVAVTVAAVALAARGLGTGWSQAVVIGMAATMSSTAIALQVLAERGLVKSTPGQSAFSVSLFQDLAVIPMLLVLGLLAPSGASQGVAFGWTQAGMALGLIAAMVLAGRLLLRPLLRIAAGVGAREIFVALALLLVVGSAWLTQSVGLSMGLGSFIAGVLLADSEYRMELEVDIEPFKGLLLGLFFIAVGMAIDLGLVLAEPMAVVLIALAAVVIKFVVLALLGRFFALRAQDGWVFAIALSHVGEFAFLLLASAQALGIFPPREAALLTAAVALSMLSTPLLFVVYERWIAPRYVGGTGGAFDAIDEHNAVIVAGAGRFGQIVARMLLGRGMTVTVIDHDPNQIELMRRFAFRGSYGDASRPDVLASAGAAEARLLVLAMDDPETVMRTVLHCRQHYPRLALLARARGRVDAFALARLGVPTVRETLGSAIDAGEQALRTLGHGAYQARGIAHRFRKHDEAQFLEQVAAQGDEARLRALAQAGRSELERLLSDDAQEIARARAAGKQVDW